MVHIMCDYRRLAFSLCSNILFPGGVAQLARAPALHAGGRRFDSDHLQSSYKHFRKRIILWAYSSVG